MIESSAKTSAQACSASAESLRLHSQCEREQPVRNIQNPKAVASQRALGIDF